ncbi:MAG: helix-turn-helix domain-containing protein [Chloroflexota bacterium]
MSKSNEGQVDPCSPSGKCPITFALDIFGDKWSLLIIRDMVFKKKKYYGEFLQSAEKISTNILADRLTKLETQRLISKTRDCQNQKKYIYRLTEKGQELLPLLLEIVEWSTKYDPQPDVPDNIIFGAPANLLVRFRTDRDNLISEILSGLNE